MFSAVLFTTLLAGAMMSQVVLSTSVLLVAFDSVGPDSIYKMPTLYNENGVLKHASARPKYLNVENPTMSFPNLHTAATGVSPEVHRVIANKMFNKDGAVMFNVPEQFSIDPELVPIWTEAAANNIKTATLMWPASNFSADNGKLTITEKYNNEGSEWDSRIIKIKEWFTSENIQFGMAYFEDTDRTETDDEYIGRVEKAIRDIYDGLKDSDVDIIIMSTHGTKQVPKSHVLKIDNYVSDAFCKVIALGPVSFLRFNNEDALQSKYESLKIVDLDNDGCADHGKIFNVYKMDESSISTWNMEDFDYLKNTLIVTTLGDYTFYDKKKYDDLSEAIDVNVVRENGYEIHDVPEMRAMLLVIGPSFEKNAIHDDVIDLKEVYQLIKKLLNITKEANDKQKIEEMSVGVYNLLNISILRVWNEQLEKEKALEKEQLEEKKALEKEHLEKKKALEKIQLDKRNGA